MLAFFLFEIDLVVRAAQPEPQRLVCWASIKVVFEFDSDPLRHLGLHACNGLSAPYKIKCNPVITAPLIGRLPDRPTWQAGVRGS